MWNRLKVMDAQVVLLNFFQCNEKWGMLYRIACLSDHLIPETIIEVLQSGYNQRRLQKSICLVPVRRLVTWNTEHRENMSARPAASSEM